MRFVLAAIVLLAFQQLAWRLPTPPPAATAPLRIESLLGDRNSTSESVELAGRVIDASPTWGEGVRLTLDVETADGAPSHGIINVSLHETSRRWRTGDRLSLRSRLRRVTGFGNFGELDWAAYNARRGIFVSASAWHDDDVRGLAPGDNVVDRLRRTFSESCARVGGQGAEILEALVIGDRTGIDLATSVAVRDAGLAHFLAISGSHMALIVALVIALVRSGAGLRPTVLERFDVLRIAAVVAGLAVIAYGAVCGGGVSVVRSELMALAAMAALWRGRPGDEMRALGGSAIVLALAMPGVGEEAGFQLSYLAVIALVIDSRRRRMTGPRPSDRHAHPPAGTADDGVRRAATAGAELLLEAARLTVVCWAVTSPVVAHHFQRISLVAPLANLLAAPLVSAIVVCGIAGLLLLPVAVGAGDLAVQLGAFLSGLVVRVAAWCASLPYAATVTPAPGVALTAALTGLALVLLLPPSRWRRTGAASLAIVATMLIASGLHDRFRSDRLDVWFASVGQGDAAIVRMPGGKVWVIDEGPPGRGRMVVGPLLRRAWIRTVDVLVASHVQSDHAGALAEILDEFDVGEIWFPDGPCDIPAAHSLLRAAERRGVPVRFVSNRSDTAEARVLSPPAGAAACNDNNQSLVMKLGFAGRSVLFTGDIEAPAEQRIAADGEAHADVLKVPHHGSRTSSTETFLDAVEPQIAVASLGVDNQFHFPAPEVESRYAAHRARFLRTDRTGAVHLAINADGKLEIETFHSPVEAGSAGSASE